ncbi:hypothetical protein AKN88_08925 [Thiopseudomonas alkaliphila]|uniref:O-antigen ligase-like membrane protein n=1 Tax=Thiopseudomonas alkaliphila TaxID=1697053 RepID=A0A0K1XFT1_9GAMM|nr:O-antigen polymerase [Thiopseudomonas alkaliphila]AKX60038.1 hypothetical protein AKN88_08925 [Thiopseudomonas alkaliphila]
MNYIVYLLAFGGLIDVLNGYFINEHGITLGVYRVLLVFILFFFSSYKVMLFIMISLSYHLIVFMAFSYELVEWATGLDLWIKFSYLILVVTFFLKPSLLDNESFNEKINQLLGLLFFLIVFTTLVALFGGGYFSYPEEMIGRVGYVYSANEYSMFVTVTCSLLTIDLLKNKKYFWCAIVLSVSIAASLLMMVKTAIVSSLILIIYFYYIHSLFFSGLSFFVKFFLQIIFLVLFLLSVYFLFEFFIKDSLFLERVYFFYNRLDFFDFLLSGRYTRVKESVFEYFNDFSLLEMFFGKSLWIYSESYHNIEMDFFDYFIRYGILFFIVYLFLLYKSLSAIFKIRDRESFLMYFGLFSFMFLFSNFIGHFLYSNMSASLIAIFYYKVFRSNENASSI